MDKKHLTMSALSLVVSMMFASTANAEDSPQAPASLSDGQASAPLKSGEQDNRLLSEMVVSAQKDKPVQQRTELGKLTVYTPVSGAVISKEELEHLQVVNNLLEIGKRVPGIGMIRNMRIPDGGKQYTESRIDGMRSTSLNTSVFDTVDMSSIERIDVITGPASALYGTGALGGTISMTSRQPSEKFTTKLSQELGDFGYERMQGYVSTSLAQGSAGFIVNSSSMDFDGWRTSYTSENANSAAEHKRGSGIKAFIRPTETTKISFGYDQLHYDYRLAGTLSWAKWQQDWRQSEPGTYGQAIDDFTTKQVRLQQFIGERGELNLAYGVIDDESTAYGGAGSGGANNVICDGGGAIGTLTGTQTVNCRSVNNNSANISNTLKYGTTRVVTKLFQYRHELDFAKTALYIGNDVYETTTDSASYGNVFSALQAQSGYWARGAMTSTGQGSITVRKDSSPFIHVEMTPMDKVRVHLGERFASVTDRTDDRTLKNKDGQVTRKGNVLRSGATYEFTQDHIIWGNLGQTFNPPSVASTLDTDVVGTAGRTLGADLKSEKALTKEVGFRGRFDKAAFQYDVALYHTNVNDFNTTRVCSPAEQIALNPNGTAVGATCNINENSGLLTAKGLESMFSWAAKDWLDVGATYVNARANWGDSNVGSNLAGQSYQALPRNRVNLRLSAKPAQGFQVELEGDYIGSYFISSDNSKGTYSRPDLYTLRSSYHNKDWSFWVHVINLTDKQYATRVSYTTVAGMNQLAASAGQGNSGSYLPRTFRVGASFNF
jgi:outer membrane receptor protein involved in Fe transport